MRFLGAAALPALVAPLLLAACAEEARPPAAPGVAPPGAYATSGPREVSPVDGDMLAMGRAEEEIDRVLADAASPASPRKPAGKAAPATDAARRGDTQKDKDGKGDVAKEEMGGAVRLGGNDACATACRALGSMATSAEHLCRLAGENDGRCDDARARLRGATARVKSSCPACTVSTATPAPAAPTPAKDVPSGPAPGMPGSSSVPIP